MSVLLMTGRLHTEYLKYSHWRDLTDREAPQRKTRHHILHPGHTHTATACELNQIQNRTALCFWAERDEVRMALWSSICIVIVM